MSGVPTTNLHITPSNVLSSGKISYKSGNPVIQFIIGEQSRGLLGQSVRLCGEFTVFKNSAEDLLAGDTIDIDPRLGAYSFIDQLVIKSQKTHAVIEHIRHYGRMMASFVPFTSNLEDNIGHQSQSALTVPNTQLMRTSLVEIASGKQTANSFCMHLPCGLFNGTQAIPLDTTGGLLVEIHLAPDSNVLYDTTGSQTAFPTAFYELKNVFLAAEAEVATAPPSVGTFEYNSISSYFTSFNSTNAIINFNLGLSNVLSVFANLIPASHINNLGFNGMATLPPTNSDGEPANIDQCVFTRGGEKFPLEYNLDTIQKSADTPVLKADQRSYDAQLIREGMSAIRKFSKMSRTLISPNNSYIQKFVNGTTGLNDNDYVDGGNCFIIGVNYDSISNQGVSFATQNWGMNLTTGLITEMPHACFVFVHSKNTLVFDGKGGMQVMS
jgi:hypothetical protein